MVLFGRDAFEPVIDITEDDSSKLPLFPPLPLESESKQVLSFPVEYVTGSAKLFVTRSIEYSHHELHFSVDKEYVFIHDDDEDIDDGDWD